MHPKVMTILVVNPNPKDGLPIQRQLIKTLQEHQVIAVESLTELDAQLSCKRFDVILINLTGEQGEAESWLAQTKHHAMRTPVLALVGEGKTVTGQAEMTEYLPLDPGWTTELTKWLGQTIPSWEEDLIRENERLQRNARLWATLSQVGRILSSTLDPDQVLELILEQAVQVLEAEGGSLLLVDQRSNELVFELALGPTAGDLIGTRLPWGVGLAGEAATTGQPLLVNNTANDPRWFSGVDEATDYTTQSILCAPMITRQQVIGVLEIVNKRDGSLFDENEAELLLALASQAAVAIENARLYDDTRQRNRELSVLYSIAMATGKTLEMSLLLDETLKQILEVLEYEGGAIYLAAKDDEGPKLMRHQGIPAPMLQLMASQLQNCGVMRQVLAQGKVIDRPVPLADWEPEMRLICVPLHTHQRALGVLIFPSFHGRPVETPEIRLLETLGRQTSIAVENAALYAELQERAETLQQAYDELAKIDQLKDELVQNISHELRTPIAFIKGYVNLLLDGDLGELSPQQSDSLEIVSNKTEQLVHLVSGILTLQTLTTEMPDVESISPIMLVARTVAAAIPAAQAAGIDLVSDYPEKLPAVTVDPPQITQVLDNLLNNAIKFSPAGGTITVKLSAEENMIRIQVLDTGIGIPADKIDRIFDRFYQIDGSSTRRFGGAGLGLAICKQIIDAHDGKFEVESEEGKGSSFAFLLPQAQSK